MNAIVRAPLAKPGTIEMVSVEWIMKHLTYSSDFQVWERSENLIRYIVATKADYSLCALIDCVMEDGMNIPIALKLKPIGPFVRLGRFARPGWRWSGLAIGNGHHRLVLAILLCLDEMPVYWVRPDQKLPCHEHTGGMSVRDRHPRASATYGQGVHAWSRLIETVKSDMGGQP
jgi:hypothetical protein